MTPAPKRQPVEEGGGVVGGIFGVVIAVALNLFFPLSLTLTVVIGLVLGAIGWRYGDLFWSWLFSRLRYF